MEDSSDPTPPNDAAPPPPVLEELSPAAAIPQERAADIEERDLAGWRAVMRNRLILSGLGILVVLLLTVVVLVVIGQGSGGPQRRVVEGASTPAGEATSRPRGGLAGEMRTTVTMRNGPGPSYSPLGTIPRGARVTVVGRNADERWLQIVPPWSSQLRGWVEASLVEVTGDVSQLAIAGPGAGPSVIVPTSIVQPTVPPVQADTPTPPSTATPTSTPAPTEVIEPTATPVPPAPTPAGEAPP